MMRTEIIRNEIKQIDSRRVLRISYNHIAAAHLGARVSFRFSRDESTNVARGKNMISISEHERN